MGGLLTFGSIGGAVEHLLAAINHAVHSFSWLTILLALGAVCFFVRHYGAATLSDVSKLLSLLAKAIDASAKYLRKGSRSLSSIFDGSDDIVDPSDPQIPALARIHRKRTSTSALVAISWVAIVIGLAAVIYEVIDTKPAAIRLDPLRPPGIVKFADRFDALYEGQPAIGGAAQRAASSLEPFSSPPSVPGIRFLQKP
jgi:hypothetical protein